MSSIWEEKPWVAAGVAAAVVGGVALTAWQVKKSRARAALYAEAAAKDEAAAPARSAALDAIDRDKYANPAAALAAAEALAKSAAPEREREAAKARVPELLSLVYHKAARAGDAAAARSLLARLVSESPESPHTSGARADWGNFLEKKLREALVANDPVRAETWFKEYRDGAYFAWRRDKSGERRRGYARVVDEYAAFQLGRGRALSAPDRRRGAGLALASEAFGVAEVFTETHALLRAADARGAGAPSTAELTMVASVMEASGMAEAALRLRLALLYRDDGATYAERRARRVSGEVKVTELALGVARRLQGKAGVVVTAQAPDEFVHDLMRSVQSAESRRKLMALRLEFATEDFLAQTAGVSAWSWDAVAADTLPSEEKVRLSEFLHAARRGSRFVSDELRRGCAEVFLQEDSAALWPLLPVRVQTAVDAALPAGVSPERLESTRREVFGKLMRSGELPPVVELSAEVEGRRVSVAALDGLYLLNSQRTEAFRALREALNVGRASPAMRERVRAAVQSVIRSAVKANRFDATVELAGFYGAEFGERLASDSFRGEFRTALETLAVKYRGSDRMKYAFTQAVLASAFAGEPFAKAAEAEALRTALEATASVTPDTREAPPVASSGLPGYAAVAVNNSTEHHILLAYEGPERCVVLCNPMRKGAFPLKAGAYKLAVITPLGDIRPYRAERALGEVQVFSEYRVYTQSSRGERHDSGAVAYGDFSLLRTGGGVPEVSVDPVTGRLRRR